MHHAKGVQIMLLKSRWIGNITAAVICIPANLYLYNCCFSENQHFTLKIKKNLLKLARWGQNVRRNLPFYDPRPKFRCCQTMVLTVDVYSGYYLL